MLTSKLILHECGHQKREVVVIKCKGHTRYCNRSCVLEHIFYKSLMYRYTRSDRWVTRTFYKIICLLQSQTKIWIIIHISESIILGQKSETWWWLFLIRIEVPIIIIDIIASQIKNISLIESKYNDRTWEATIRTYLITILIQNQISYRFIVSEEFKKLFLMSDSICEVLHSPWEENSDIMHFCCKFRTCCNMLIYISCSR